MNRTGATIEPVIVAMASLPAAIVAVIQSRFDPDLMAFVGAVVAAIVTVLEAVEHERKLSHRVMVFLSSVVVGSVGPGGIVWKFYRDQFETLSWHAWAGLGFAGGLLGWAVVSALMGLRGGVPGFLNNFLTLWLKKKP